MAVITIGSRLRQLMLQYAMSKQSAIANPGA
jgi:hypothetical protein